MKKILPLLLIALFALTSISTIAKTTIPIYVWTSFSPRMNDSIIRKEFQQYKDHGITGVCVGSGMDIKAIERFSRIAHEFGMEYHAWVTTMPQYGQDSTWYTVNRLGQSAYNHPAYVPYYRTLDPNKPEVQQYLINQLSKLADIPTVDYIQLDYIRYADVILAKGLWEKYKLVMNEEYPAADYCYCDKCVAEFKEKTGIDIKKVEDPSKCAEWARFRCDKITELVNNIADAIHAKGKKVSADVFPGPDSYAKWMVRQQWDEWNIDAFFPMNYNDFYLESPAWVGEVTREGVQSIKSPSKKSGNNNKSKKVKGRKLYSGLFICNDWRNKSSIKDPEGHGLLPSEINEAVIGSMKAGADGICLFTARSMTPEHWAELEKISK